MKHENSTQEYERWYARLLQLYPKTYRRQFSEPMLQTFADMCNEQKRSNENIGWFVIGIFAETFVGIIKESSREVAMNIKENKSKMVLIGGLITLLAASGGVLIMNKPGNAIGPWSSYEEVKKQPNDKKEKCLADNPQAAEAVNKDDAWDGEWSEFETEVSQGFRDVPAGTNYDTTVNSYDGKMAKGAILYDGEYGTYNYTVNKLSGAGEWKFVSMVACSN